MTAFRLLVVGTATLALLFFGEAAASARGSAMGGGYGSLPPNYGSLPPNYGQIPSLRRPGHGGHRPIRGGFIGGGFIGGGVWVVEREVPAYIAREVVVREVPVEAPPPPEPREPHVIGKTYASLPGGCMKMIDEGVSYYGCSGEWYRETGSGSSIRYTAVKAP